MENNYYSVFYLKILKCIYTLYVSRVVSLWAFVFNKKLIIVCTFAEEDRGKMFFIYIKRNTVKSVYVGLG